MVGEQFDASSDPPVPEPKPEQSYLGVRFDCCNAYRRIHLNRTGDAYVGHCPKCGRPVRVEIRADGSSDRFFTAY